ATPARTHARCGAARAPSAHRRSRRRRAKLRRARTGPGARIAVASPYGGPSLPGRSDGTHPGGPQPRNVGMPVPGLDWIIVVFCLAMALWGFVQGLIVGALSLAGFAAGALVGARVAPVILQGGSHSPYAPLFALLGAIMLGGVLAMGLET